MKIAISSIREKAKTRPEGYYNDVLSRGSINGEFLFIKPDDYRFLLQKYDPHTMAVTGSACCGQMPPVLTQAKNFIQAVGQTAAAVIQGKQIMASDETVAKRRETCQSCEFLQGSRCTKCGCAYKSKILLEQQRCPIGKWV